MFRLKLNQIVFKKFKTLDLDYDKSNKHLWKIKYFFYLQAVRAAQDEQLRLKDVEINELKSVRMDLDRELRDVRTVADRVGVLVRQATALYSTWYLLSGYKRIR